MIMNVKPGDSFNLSKPRTLVQIHGMSGNFPQRVRLAFLCQDVRNPGEGEGYGRRARLLRLDEEERLQKVAGSCGCFLSQLEVSIAGSAARASDAGTESVEDLEGCHGERVCPGLDYKMLEGRDRTEVIRP